ncbi:hypothetical protein J7E91_00755 [Streptomyces sp. ISL-99]|uniref:hypothetical protein n=1 Tax=Streptomyces sp. ISL-99 TaxID=2819193 RepID=UPI001BEA0AC1|nr:hypothetical protein [Streptomyces sp. ISL-99]MBT2523995.1 hypothetical protein [Streptomyces sp. ISL-99]
MSSPNFRRRTAVRALTTGALAAALLAPAATAVAAGPAGPSTAVSARTFTSAAEAAARAKAATPVRVQKLVDGSTARIFKLGARHYRMDNVSRDGYLVGTLVARNADAGGQHNGMFVVLTADGDVVSWVGREHYGAGSFALPDGSTAKVAKVAAGHFTLKIVHQGRVMATLVANQRDAAVNANGMYIVLNPDGTHSAWIG